MNNTKEKIPRISDQRKYVKELLDEDVKYYNNIKKNPYAAEADIQLNFNIMYKNKEDAKVLFDALDVLEKMGVKP